MTPQNEEALEAAADIDPRPRLHIITHPEAAAAAQAAAKLAGMLGYKKYDTIRPAKSRWTVTDSREARAALSWKGACIILEGTETASRGALDPLLKELENQSGSTLIVASTRPMEATLAGRAHTTVLSAGSIGRRRSGGPSAQRLLQDAPNMMPADPRLSGALRAHSGTAFGARLADAILASRKDGDLPPALLAALLLERTHPKR